MATTDEKAQTELWRGITADQTIGPELRQFSAAVPQRFGDDPVRAMLRNRGEAASVPRAHQAAVATVSLIVNTLRQRERVSERQIEARCLTLGYRAGLKP